MRGEVGVSEHDRGDVLVPGLVPADPVVVEPYIGLGLLQAFLDGPAWARDADECVDAGAGRISAHVEDQLSAIGDAAPDKNPPVAAGVVAGAGRAGQRPDEAAGRWLRRRLSMVCASCGFVANATSAGILVSSQRSRSPSHVFGRYNSRSISARHCHLLVRIADAVGPPREPASPGTHNSSSDMNQPRLSLPHRYITLCIKESSAK